MQFAGRCLNLVQRLVTHWRQVPEAAGSASLQQDRLRGLAARGEHCAVGSRLWLPGCGIPFGLTHRHGLGPNEEFCALPWRERPNGL